MVSISSVSRNVKKGKGRMELRDMIREKFRSEAACARKMGWSRQRFHTIVSGKRLPNVRELNQIAAVLERSVDELLPLFLRKR